MSIEKTVKKTPQQLLDIKVPVPSAIAEEIR